MPHPTPDWTKAQVLALPGGKRYEVVDGGLRWRPADERPEILAN